MSFRVTGLLAMAIAIGAAHAAAAADLPVPAKAPPISPAAVPAAYNWTGFYIGGQGGYAWGTSHQTQGASDTGDYNIDGGFGGGTIGYNFQFNSFLAGVEADFSGSGIKGTAGPGRIGHDYGCAPGLCETDVEWFGTLRGRFGYVVNQFLFYGTGGWAYGRVRALINDAIGFDGTSNQSGWTAGGGVEYGFTPNWSAKVEYLYTDLGNFTFGQAGTQAAGAASSAHFSLVRFGLNYRFGSLSR